MIFFTRTKQKDNRAHVVSSKKNYWSRIIAQIFSAIIIAGSSLLIAFYSPIKENTIIIEKEKETKPGILIDSPPPHEPPPQLPKKQQKEEQKAASFLSLKGRVTNQGSPLSGTIVSVGSQSTQCDSEGCFKFKFPKEDLHDFKNFSFRKKGFKPKTIKYTIADNSINIELSKTQDHEK